MAQDQREQAISQIKIGDVFHADCPSGPSMICLALDVTDTSIHCRTVTTHEYVVFDRVNGTGLYGRSPAEIDSVAPLPPEIHQAMLSLDSRINIKDITEEQMALTRSEKDGLIFVARFYPAHPLP